MASAATHSWFTVGVSPAPPELKVEYRSDGETRRLAAPALLLQYRYPVDKNGERIPGSDWVDSRVITPYVEDGRWLVPNADAEA